MHSLIWMTGFYLVGVAIERMSWKWLASVPAVAGLDVAYRIYVKLEQAQAHGTEFAWPPHKIVGTWLVLSAFAGVFFALGRWKASARRRRRAELGLR
jgi:hypothetical protein